MRLTQATANLYAMVRCLTLVALVCCLALQACGQSEADKAKSDVCDARDDIASHVDNLKGMTISTATTSDIKENLTAIQGDLGKIKDARGKLDDNTRKQVDAANQAFTAQLNTIRQNLGTNLSLSSAATQLKSAIAALATAYQQAWEPIDCS
jgi:uncharacterized protein YjbJ (UPF0337 family)